MDARGSIRKAPNVITWALPLDKLRQSGDKYAGAIIKKWDNRASRQQQLMGGKAQAPKYVLDMMPQGVFTENNGSSGERDGLGEQPLER